VKRIKTSEHIFLGTMKSYVLDVIENPKDTNLYLNIPYFLTLGSYFKKVFEYKKNL